MITYDPKIAPVANTAPEGWDDAAWHRSATAHSGEGYTSVGKVHVVACAWCREAFIGPDKTSALALFREHEGAMMHYDPLASLVTAVASDTGVATKWDRLAAEQLDEMLTEVFRAAAEHSRAISRKSSAESVAAMRTQGVDESWRLAEDTDLSAFLRLALAEIV